MSIKYPYTDFHEMNLDWIIKTAKDVATRMTTVEEAVSELHEYVHDYFDNLDVQEEINNKIDEMAANGELLAVILPYLGTELEDVNNNIIALQNNQAVLEHRMDEFASLPAGSTAGNAELVDIRVGANGITYPSAGDAVRGQYDELNDEIHDYNSQLIYDPSAMAGTDTTDVGIRYQWDSNGVCTVSGTSAGYSWCTMYQNQSGFPAGFAPGQKVYLRYTGNVCALQLVAREGGAWNSFARVTSPQIVEIPSGASGLWIRLTVAQGDSISGTEVVYPRIYTAMPNIELSEIYEHLDLMKNLTNVSDSLDISNVNMWEQGTINANTGAELTSTTRFRTVDYLPTNAERVNTNNTNYAFYIYAYTVTGSYVGIFRYDYNFDPTGTAYSEYDVGDIIRRYPNYRFKLSLFAVGSAPTPTINDCAAVTITNSITDDGEPKTVRVMQYNIGKFNFGLTAGIESGGDIKLENYKKYFADKHPDIVCLQEYVDYIDRAEQIDAEARLFAPVYWYKSHQERECVIYSDYLMQRDDFSYLQVSGDPPAWVVFGDVHIKGRLVRVVTGVLNVTATQAQKLTCIDKLINQVCAGYDNVIICMDTNVNSYDESVAVRDMFSASGYNSANWTYFGYIPTYRVQAGVYRYIDNIFVKGNIKVKSIETGEDKYDDLASDHYPVICDLTVR